MAGGAALPAATEPPLLILVSAAPFAPYPSLLASGPQATWMRGRNPNVTIWTHSGTPLSPARKQVSDLRDMLRYTGAPLGHLGTVNDDAPLLRAYGAVASIAQPPEAGAGLGRTASAWMASRSIMAAGRAATVWEKRVLSSWKDRRTLRVTRAGTHLTVHHPSTMSNSLANQLAVIKYLAQQEPFAGVCFVTSSAYVDVDRLVAWSREHSSGIVVGGSNALADRGGMGRPFLSGFCNYFSWGAVRMLAAAKGFDHSVLNDDSLTQWLLAHDIPWVDPGIVWFTEPLDGGQCPLCENLSKTVVRCTSHGSRWKEAEYMRQLDHVHVGDQT